MLLQIGWRSAKDPAAGRKLPRHQARIVHLRDANRDVDALPDDIHDVIGCDDLDAKIGIFLHEAAKIGRYVQPAEGSGSRYSERSASALVAGRHEGFRFLNGVENLHHSLIKTAAGLRELQLPCRPVEKSRAKPGFEMTNSLADDRRRKIQLTSGCRHAAGSDDPANISRSAIEVTAPPYHSAQSCIQPALEIVQRSYKCTDQAESQELLML